VERRTFLRNLSLTGAAAVAGPALLAACGGGGTAGKSAAGGGAEAGTLSISNTPANQSPNDFSTIVAGNLGIYQKYGVTTSLTNGTTASLPPLFLRGGVDVLCHGSALFTQALQNQHVKIICGLGSVSPYSFIARDTIGTVADLRGKPIGVQLVGSGSVYALNVFALQKAGLTEKDVKFVAIAGFADQLAALAAGRIEAAMLPYDQAYLAQQLKGVRVLDNNPTAGGFQLAGYRFAGVQAAFAEKNPELVTNFVTALIAVQRVLATDRATYEQQVKVATPKLAAGADQLFDIQQNNGYWSVNGGLDPQWIQANLDYYRNIQTKQGGKVADVTGADLAATQYVKAALDKLGKVDAKIDSAAWYTK
jgi:ABC-type nitrate/sulfonate/bicarbonate transport system substrate-binding protein